MASVQETFGSDGKLIVRRYFDDDGQEINAATAASRSGNRQQVATLLAQALTDLDAVIAAASVPATVGSLAQAQTAVRAIQNHVGNMAQHLKRAIRYEIGDFTGTG